MFFIQNIAHPQHHSSISSWTSPSESACRIDGSETIRTRFECGVQPKTCCDASRFYRMPDRTTVFNLSNFMYIRPKIARGISQWQFLLKISSTGGDCCIKPLCETSSLSILSRCLLLVFPEMSYICAKQWRFQCSTRCCLYLVGS